MNEADEKSLFDGPRAITRVEAASFLFARQHRIRAVARTVLTRWARAITSSEEVFSSVLRRVDEVAASDRLRPQSPGELWHYVRTVTLNTAISKNRAAARLAELIEDSGSELVAVQERVVSCESDEEVVQVLCRVLAALERSDDQELFSLRFRGASHEVLAKLLGTTDTAVRKRWSELCRRIRDAAEQGRLDVE